MLLRVPLCFFRSLTILPVFRLPLLYCLLLLRTARPHDSLSREARDREVYLREGSLTGRRWSSGPWGGSETIRRRSCPFPQWAESRWPVVNVPGIVFIVPTTAGGDHCSRHPFHPLLAIIVVAVDARLFTVIAGEQFAAAPASTAASDVQPPAAPASTPAADSGSSSDPSTSSSTSSIHAAVPQSAMAQET